MKIGDAVNKDSEYKTFKKYLAKEGVSEVEALKNLAKYSKYYTWIQHPEKAEGFDSKSANSDRITTSERLMDLKELNTSSMAPLLLFLLEKSDSGKFDKDRLNDTLYALESWAFRVRTSGYLTSGAFNTISSTSILNSLKRSGSSDFDKQVVKILSNYKTQDIWPDDDDFKESFKKYNFYKTYKNYVQRKLEQFRSNEKHNWRPNSIEHIMPETLSREWKNKLGDNYAEIHGEYLHTIGNLAPLNLKDNIINSNALFIEKEPQYEKSDWFLTREIRKDAGNCEDWGVEQIQIRAGVLAEAARKIWRGPDDRVEPIEAEVRKKSDDYRRIIPEGKACNTIFHLNWKNIKPKDVDYTITIDARMRIEIINGKPHFIVMAGSKICPYVELGKKVNKAEKEIRECGWNDEVVLEEDVDVFTSPSGAADFVTGGSANGWIVWLNDDGETLDDVVASDIEKSYEEIGE